jgi:hypothetical protein
MERELLRLYDAGEGEGKTVLPSIAAKKIKWTVDGTAYEKELNAREYERYARRMGTMNYDELTALTKSKSYEELNDSEKATAVSMVYAMNANLTQSEFSERPLSGDNETARSVGLSVSEYAVLKANESGWNAKVNAAPANSEKRAKLNNERFSAMMELVNNLSVSGEAKIEIAQSLGNGGLSDSQAENYKIMLQNGITFAKSTEVYEKFRETDGLSDYTANEKATEFYYWLDKNSGLTVKQKSVVQSELSFWSMTKAEGSLRKLLASEKYGIDNDVLKQFNDGVREQKEKLQKTALTKDELTKLLRGSAGLSKEQKAALWQQYNVSWKPYGNPFSVSIGMKIYDELNAE